VSLSDGDDGVYSGMSVSPCSSLLNETEHFGGVNGRKEMNVKRYRDVTKRHDLSNVDMKSNSTATIVLTFQNNLAGSGTSATDNAGSLSFSFFDFACGSTLGRKFISLLSSSPSSLGSLELTHCGIMMTGNGEREYSLMKVSGGALTVSNVKIGQENEYSFKTGISLFELSTTGNVQFSLCSQKKMRMIDGSLFSLSSSPAIFELIHLNMSSLVSKSNRSSVVYSIDPSSSQPLTVWNVSIDGCVASSSECVEEG
jgi:hypothetical protein